METTNTVTGAAAGYTSGLFLVRVLFPVAGACYVTPQGTFEANPALAARLGYAEARWEADTCRTNLMADGAGRVLVDVVKAF